MYKMSQSLTSQFDKTNFKEQRDICVKYFELLYKIGTDQNRDLYIAVTFY